MIEIRRSGEARLRRPRLAQLASTPSPSPTTTTRSTWASAPLRVINEDRVAAGAGLRHPRAPRHGDHHATCSRAQLAHKDSMGTGSVDPARRRAAHERRHRRAPQRVQPSKTEPCTSCRSGSSPNGAASRRATSRSTSPRRSKRGRLRLIASPDGARRLGARSTRTRACTPGCSTATSSAHARRSHPAAAPTCTSRAAASSVNGSALDAGDALQLTRRARS